LEGYRITTDKDEFDFKVIHEFIGKSYWAEGIPEKTLIRAINNSLCFAIFSSAGEQIGFARMVTDKATFGYLADVFIIDAHRGKGLSIWLIREILSHPDLQGLRRINLATRDAHDLYKKFGFQELSSPDRIMEILNADVYKNA
jgi:N-acetylglutamate synthase-like GNAT family acetyltransferase